MEREARTVTSTRSASDVDKSNVRTSTESTFIESVNAEGCEA